MSPLMCNTHDSLKKLFALCLLTALLPSCTHKHDSSNQIPHNSGSESDPVELIYNEKEEREASWDRWIKEKNQANFVEIVNAGFDGDRGALHLLGMCYLLGADGITIDTATADQLFAFSASLGFAPGVDELRAKYFKESNPFLGMVYINLCIALGHKEFIKIYHELREKMIRDFGQSINHTIEKLASEKMDLILKNQELLRTTDNRHKFVILQMKNITDEDNSYDQDFWKLTFNLHMYLKNAGLTKVEELDDIQKIVAAQVIKILSGMPEKTNNQITHDNVKQYIKKCLPTLLKTEDGRAQALDDISKLLQVPIIIGEASEIIIKKYPNMDPQAFKIAIENATREQINNIIDEFKCTLQVHQAN